ncbi:MAG: serine/threonine-protein kinase [Ignavibacteriaceae bacterium]
MKAMNNSGNNLLFGKFEILETLKKDEFSGVYIANHHYLGKKIILKTLDTINLNDATIQERFKREAKILAQLDHPNIIKVLDFGTEGSRLYISFEFFESKNLREYIRDQQPDNQTKKNLLIQLLRGLNYAHGNNIIHRDLKPENILVNKSNNLKIADFGLASAANDSAVTKKSSILGTPSYMSPEQIIGGEVSFQSDLFALGIVIYEMYTSVNPFVKSDINATINFILNYTEDSLDGIKLLPEDIKEAVAKLLQKSKIKRTKKCSDVLTQLNVSEESFTEFRVASGKFSSIRKRLILYAILIVFLGAVSLVYYINYYSNNSKQLREDIKGYDTLTTYKGNTILPDEVSPVIKEQRKDEKVKEDLQMEEELKKSENIKPDEIVNIDLNINCSPWATIYIDGQKVDLTPLNKTLPLKEGTREISLVHPEYPEYKTRISVKKDQVISLRVNLDDIFASISFQVLPWGEVFIDGKSYGETPIKRKIHLSEGNYRVIVKNPDFPEYSETISLKKGQDFTLMHNFRK